MPKGDWLRELATGLVVVAILAIGVFGTHLIQEYVPVGGQPRHDAHPTDAAQQPHNAPQAPTSCNDLIDAAASKASERYDAYYACNEAEASQGNLQVGDLAAAAWRRWARRTLLYRQARRARLAGNETTSRHRAGRL